MSVINTPLQRELRRRMIEKKLSMRGLSLKAGLNATAVKAIMRGNSQHPRHDTIEKLATALDCTPDDLLGTAPNNGNVLDQVRNILRAAGLDPDQAEAPKKGRA
jgi:DNA-binding Xre family transcriptional regulator